MYHELFYEMEALDVLQADSELDLFVLHCVFLPRIRKSLSEFRKAWNLHPLRTEHDWCPRKIWINSVMRDSVDTSFNLRNASMYSVDPAGPLPDEELTTVTVPEIISPLEGEELCDFLDSINTSTAFSSYDMGISYFLSTKRRLYINLFHMFL